MRRRSITAEQEAFIRTQAETLSTRQLASAYTQQFDEPIGQTEMRRIMGRLGIKSAHKQTTSVPIGTEVYTAYYDCMKIKVSDTPTTLGKTTAEKRGIRDANWKLKQNWVWEQHTGKPIPWRNVVMFLDNNRMNYDIDNLYCVPIEVAGTITKLGMWTEDPVLNKTALMWGELFYALKRGGNTHDKH